MAISQTTHFIDQTGKKHEFQGIPRGAYAAIGVNGSVRGNIYKMFAGALIPLCDEQGKQLNAGEDKGGLIYDKATDTWTRE